MPRVKFLEERIVQDEHRHDPSKQTVFKAGEVYDLSDASYQHWLARAPLELESVSAPSRMAASASAAPASPPPAAETISFPALPETSALGEAPLSAAPDDSPSATEKSPPKPGGKPKG